MSNVNNKSKIGKININLNKLLILLPLVMHNGGSWFHVPSAWQVLASNPNRLYVSIHIKEAKVSTWYPPFTNGNVL